MSYKLSRLTKIFAAAGAVAVMSASASADVVIARIPIRVNFAAQVDLIRQYSVVGNGSTKTVTANVWDTLDITVDAQKTSVFGRQDNGRQNAVPTTAARYRYGALSLELNPQQYGSASIALYSVSGKRVLSGKASAASGAFNVSRSNVAPGVYLLSVKGVDGNSYSTKLTHSGGRLDINATFGGGVLSLGKEALAKSASGNGWLLRVIPSAGFKPHYEHFDPIIGLNPARDITIDLNAFEFRDKTYRCVKIGTQVWMAENLNHAGVCYNSLDEQSCAKYGRLYTWNEAMGACPPGWHLPTDAEWETLITVAGGSEVAGGKLKSQTDWVAYEGIGSTNEFGFSALPGGFKIGDGSGGMGQSGFWWSASETNETHARFAGMHHENNQVSTGFFNKDVAKSVRCILDD